MACSPTINLHMMARITVPPTSINLVLRRFLLVDGCSVCCSHRGCRLRCTPPGCNFGLKRAGIVHRHMHGIGSDALCCIAMSLHMGLCLRMPPLPSESRYVQGAGSRAPDVKGSEKHDDPLASPDQRRLRQRVWASHQACYPCVYGSLSEPGAMEGRQHENAKATSQGN